MFLQTKKEKRRSFAFVPCIHHFTVSFSQPSKLQHLSPPLRHLHSMIDHPKEASISTIQSHQNNPTSVTGQKRVEIPNHHGGKLVGILHETGSKELIPICHGIKSSKDRIPMVSLACALEKIGLSALRFDFAGNGESEGSFRYGNYRQEAEDLRAVVQYFRGTGRVINMIIGHSKGGNVVLLYASKYHDVCGVINISGRSDLSKGLEGRLGRNFLERIKRDKYIDVYGRSGKFQYRVTEESLMDRLSTDIQQACLLIHHNCRVLTVHGSKDQIVPLTDAFKFEKIISNHVLRIVDGADHEYTLHQDELVKLVLDFIKGLMDQGSGMKNNIPSCVPTLTTASGVSRL